MKKYYLADSIGNPTEVIFIDYFVCGSVGDVLIMLSCKNLRTGEIEYYHPSSLYKSKAKASDTYLMRKGEYRQARL